MKPEVEVLAPAGSIESMTAAINAGADAVYMGGSRFGARAYADNPEKDQFLEAIDYAHLHGCRLYMTVNTLVKEQELEELYDFLRPYYERGLDAVIVQDMGVFRFVREQFPDLAVHASTQMTITGKYSAEELKRLGASRIVTARELSLKEIRTIHENVDIEIESFVHGALCYCYSGQCLMSSLIGGRSGNRGRCAQPCRLTYEAEGIKDKRNSYLLNLKDLCTLDILPEIIEAGVYSLKIEGRMKSPRYTAGVVSIYRKYVDLYQEKGKEGYHVDPEDKRILLELFDRGGQTTGYYKQHNGRDMIAVQGKPAFREADQALFARLDKQYVEAKKQEPVGGTVKMREGEPLSLTLRAQNHEITVTGAVVQTAQNQPMTEEKLKKQLNKTGNAAFYFADLQCELQGNCFVPVQALNELRRNGMECLEQKILETYYRMAADRIREEHTREKKLSEMSGTYEINEEDSGNYQLHVSLEELEQRKEVIEFPNVSEIYIDACGFPPNSWSETVDLCHKNKKKCALIFPQIFRQEAEQLFRKNHKELSTAGFDELIIRSMEEPGFLKEEHIDVPMVFDANLYAMNHLASGYMYEHGAKRLTLPLELNSRELKAVGCEQKELIVYGYLPAMVSAQCICKTTKGCSHRPELMYMRDRTGKRLPVKNHCVFCYNTIYNPAPLSLLGQKRIIDDLKPSVLRLQFTIEKPEQIRRILQTYADYFLYGQETEEPARDFTRGHFKRGIE